ncbi:ERF family protein [Neobacillus mesonae]|nr:ERF family protein [Neobacillus mesonae]
MTDELKELNLYQKIVQVRQVAEGFSKDTKGYGYSYVSGNQVLSKIKDKMNELNLLLMPSTQVGEHHMHAYKTAKGKDALDFVVKGEMSYTWINGDNPDERETVNWAYYGQQDDISKAYGSALTYSERYYLLKSLGLPTDEDDPDSKDTKGKTAAQPNESEKLYSSLKAKWKMLNGGNLEGLDEWVKSMLEKNYHLPQIERVLTKKIQEKKEKGEALHAE